MKNTLIKILLILTPLLSQSQIAIERGGDNGNLPKNFKETGQYYYKDVHNYLDDFIGTWSYIESNKEFKLILSKSIKSHINIPELNLNYYEDGINIQYKQYENGNLVYTSPVEVYPSLYSIDGVSLTGTFTDYNRLTGDLLHPVTNEVLASGGHPITPICNIKKIVTLPNEPKQIKFSLSCHMGCRTYNNIYDGLPRFSVPNRVVLTKQ